jgi:hypothetical protein
MSQDWRPVACWPGWAWIFFKRGCRGRSHPGAKPIDCARAGAWGCGNEWRLIRASACLIFFRGGNGSGRRSRREPDPTTSRARAPHGNQGGPPPPWEISHAGAHRGNKRDSGARRAHRETKLTESATPMQRHGHQLRIEYRRLRRNGLAWMQIACALGRRNCLWRVHSACTTTSDIDTYNANSLISLVGVAGLEPATR